MGTTRGGRPTTRATYYVALAGIVTLLVLLCCYFFYFCVKRVKELSRQELLDPVSSLRPPPKPTSYPVQTEVRDSATAMARLCQLPARSDSVFPSAQQSTLPAPRILSRQQSPAKQSTANSTPVPQLTVEQVP